MLVQVGEGLIRQPTQMAYPLLKTFKLTRLARCHLGSEAEGRCNRVCPAGLSPCGAKPKGMF